MQRTVGRPDRTLLVILSIIVAMVLLALVVVFTRGAPAPLDPSTPEGVVQSYSTAVIEGESSDAMKYLTRDLQDNCDRVYPGSAGQLRLTLISTDITGVRAEVRVSVSSGQSSGPFGGSSYSSDQTFVLIRDSAGDWKIDSTPWELEICYRMEG